MTKKLNKKGFTLTELIVVIAIIAILAAVLIPTSVVFIGKAKENADLQEATSAYKAWAAYATSVVDDDATLVDVERVVFYGTRTNKAFYLHEGKIQMHDTVKNGDSNALETLYPTASLADTVKLVVLVKNSTGDVEYKYTPYTVSSPAWSAGTQGSIE